MEIRDSLTLDASGLTLTRDGFLVGEAKVSRAGNVQMYYGAELGLTNDDAGKVFGVYRDPDVVFDEKSMLSLAGRPVTRGHPPVAVDASNWKDLTVGQVGGTIKRDGEHVVAPMAIMDADAAKEVANGARSLSAGYTVGLVRDEGIAPDGTPYQFRQADALRFNHVAYLPDNNPRAGNTRIGDADPARWGAAPITLEDKQKGTRSMTNRTLMVDGLSVELADKDAQIVQRAIDGLNKQIADLQSASGEAKATIAAKDTEIGSLKVDLKKAQDAALKPEDVDKLVADRSALVATVTAIDSKIEIKGSDADLRRAAVKSKLGDEMVKDASDAEVAGMFKAIAKDAKPVDQFARVVADGVKQHGDAAGSENKAWSDSVSDMNAWRNKKEA